MARVEGDPREPSVRTTAVGFPEEKNDIEAPPPLVLPPGVKACPACGMLIEKISGDDQMMCGDKARVAGGKRGAAFFVCLSTRDEERAQPEAPIAEERSHRGPRTGTSARRRGCTTGRCRAVRVSFALPRR